MTKKIHHKSMSSKELNEKYLSWKKHERFKEFLL